MLVFQHIDDHSVLMANSMATARPANPLHSLRERESVCVCARARACILTTEVSSVVYISSEVRLRAWV